MKEKKEFKCDLCSRSCITLSELKMHQSEVHKIGNVKEYKCDICGKTFSKKGNLNIHKKIHEGKTFECHKSEK